MEKHIEVSRAGTALSTLVGEVASGVDCYIVDREGHPLAALLGLTEYRALRQRADSGGGDGNGGAASHADGERQPIEERFDQLKRTWKRDTRFAPTVHEAAMHPAYQQIIGMGWAGVPLLLRELATRPDHWFWALKAITGEDPVPEVHHGNVPEMTRAWLEWGTERGYGHAG